MHKNETIKNLQHSEQGPEEDTVIVNESSP